MSLRRPTLIDLSLLFLTALIWAGAFVAIKIGVQETGPWWLATWRVTLGFLILLPFTLLAGLKRPGNSSAIGILIIMSVLNLVVPYVLISWAETRISAGVTSLLMGVGPFMAILLAHFFIDDERLSPRKAIAVAMGFSGVLLIVGFEALSGIGAGNLIGQVAALAASMSYVIAGLLIRKIDLDPLTMSTYALGIGSSILIPMAYAIEGPPNLALSAAALQAVAYLGIMATAFAYIMRFHLIQKIGYSTFALAIYLIPVFGVLLGWLLVGDAITPRIVIALILVVCGLFVARGRTPQAP